MNKSRANRKRQRSGVRDASGLRQMQLDAAGIDIGSEIHYVAVPADRDEQPVRRFGCLTPELQAMARWLKQCSITTVAMESTGVYWVPVAQVLEEWGFDVWLVDARQARNVPGRKTDVQDCQWLQELHSYGLLRRAFRPEQDVRALRSYWRHRAGLVEMCSQQIHLMQKAFEQMNIQLHKVLSDITGVTGMRIIRAILAGQRDPVALAQLCHPSVKNPRDMFAQALTGTYREEHLFELQQAIELYDVLRSKIAACDQKVQQYLQRMEGRGNPDELAERPGKRKNKPRKNEPGFDLRAELYRLTGVDLTSIDGIDALTAQTVISEQGFDMSPFPTEKNFASHLGVCPNNEKTGGKITHTRTRKVQSRAAKALRLAAQSLHHSQTALGAFYRRLRARLGPAKAITATAHKLARLIYRMLKYGQDYVDIGQEYYERLYRERLLRNLVRQAKQMGYELIKLQTLESVS